MPVSRAVSRRGFSPAAIVLLLITAMVGGGVEIRPEAAAGCSIAADDHGPEPQAREESPEESADDEDSGAAKTAFLDSTVVIDELARRSGRLNDSAARLSADGRRGTAPIRGPPSRA